MLVKNSAARGPLLVKININVPLSNRGYHRCASLWFPSSSYLLLWGAAPTASPGGQSSHDDGKQRRRKTRGFQPLPLPLYIITDCS
jgi:hypothetical protein